jgi:plastocyanin
MTSRFSAITLVLLLVGALAACSSPAASSVEPEPTEAQESQAAEPSETAEESEAAAGEETVRIDGSQFDPSELTIAVGTEVSWVNADSFAHTVTEGTDGTPVDDPIIDEEIAQNATVSVTFDEPGTYEITCKIHPSMQMTITVEG